MENYEKDKYYLILGIGVIRIVNNENSNSYKFYDLLTREHREFFSKKLKLINEVNKEEEVNSSPFTNLSLSDCNFLIFDGKKETINSLVNDFLNKIAQIQNSSLCLFFENNVFKLKGSRLEDFNLKGPIMLNDNINDFFNQIEKLKLPLTIDEKDKFILKILNNKETSKS